MEPIPSGCLSLLKITKLQRLYIHETKAQRTWPCHISNLFFCTGGLQELRVSRTHQPCSCLSLSAGIDLQLWSMCVWLPLSGSPCLLPSFSSLPHLFSSSQRFSPPNILVLSQCLFVWFPGICLHCLLGSSGRTGDSMWRTLLAHSYDQLSSRL